MVAYARPEAARQLKAAQAQPHRTLPEHLDDASRVCGCVGHAEFLAQRSASCVHQHVGSEIWLYLYGFTHEELQVQNSE